MAETERQRYERQYSELETERSTWDSHWRELGDNFAPRTYRFETTERNRGTRRNGNVINSRPVTAARTLAAGMSGGLTSPARPWFRLTTADPALAKRAAVASWLHQVQELMYQALSRSNIYSVLPDVYLTLGTYGTPNAVLLEEDTESLVRAYQAPIGSYVLDAGPDGRVNTFARRYSMTPAQLVEKFGPERVSSRVRELVETGKRGTWVDVVHHIGRNRERVLGRRDYRGMPWKSCWYERCGKDAKPEVEFLRTSGFWEFPVLAPRWSRTGEDVYGSNSPGMTALGDARALQVMEKREGQVAELLTRPPMRAPSTLRGQRASLVPGDITYVDAAAAGQKFEPAYTVDARALEYLGLKGRELERLIDEAFFADLWLMLSRSDGDPQKTAREIAERHEEKMLQLGPVLELLNDELLSPLIDRFFGALQRLGMVPPPPAELQGMELRVEYVSILHAAQKLVKTAGHERIAAFTGSLASIWGPGMTATPVTDLVDTDELVRQQAEALGLHPEILRSPEEVAQIRAERAKQQAAAAQAEAAQAVAQGAATLAKADTGGDNALTRVAGALGGQAAQLVPMGRAA